MHEVNQEGHMVSLSDVARAAGVSISTASLALRTERRVSAETRARVLEAAKTLRYVPNELGRSMRSGRANTLGIVIQQTTEHIFSHPYFTETIGGITEVATAAGYPILLSVSSQEESEDAYLRLLDSRRADGIILLAIPLADTSAQRIVAAGLPVVLMGEWVHPTPICNICIDDRTAAIQAVEHLIALGRQRIAHIIGKGGHSSAVRREEGYRTALTRAGRTVDMSLLRHGDFSVESGRIAMESLLHQSERPDAIFAASDEMAVGALQVLHEHGVSVPGEIAVVGFDDVAMAQLTHPPLTTIHHPMREMARDAARLLIEQINGERVKDTPTIFPTHLVIRASSVSSAWPAQRVPTGDERRCAFASSE
jgi:LacI family repressor for deo operon, udp, cdd, tsx, nupC, and nupG